MPWSFGNNSFFQLSTAGLFGWGILLLMAWSLIWKGLALWHTARRGEKLWFIVLLVLNTIGLLEIIYLIFVAKIFSHIQTKALKTKKKALKKK